MVSAATQRPPSGGCRLLAVATAPVVTAPLVCRAKGVGFRADAHTGSVTYVTVVGPGQVIDAPSEGSALGEVRWRPDRWRRAIRRHARRPARWAGPLWLGYPPLDPLLCGRWRPLSGLSLGQRVGGGVADGSLPALSGRWRPSGGLGLGQRVGGGVADGSLPALSGRWRPSGGLGLGQRVGGGVAGREFAGTLGMVAPFNRVRRPSFVQKSVSPGREARPLGRQPLTQRGPAVGGGRPAPHCREARTGRRTVGTPAGVIPRTGVSPLPGGSPPGAGVAGATECAPPERARLRLE